MRGFILIVLASSLLWGCASTPRQPTRGPAEAAEFALAASAFERLPGWADADLAPALLAFTRACEGRRARAQDAALPGGGRYGGTVADWTAACAAAVGVTGAERAFFETHFIPRLVQGGGEARLTAYYEPIIEARRAPDAYFSAPLVRRPGDLVSVDIAAFAEAYDDQTLRGAPRRLTGQIVGNEVRPYPRRGELNPAPGAAFAWAHPVDVYNLQIQGSGRISFPD
ncbi:MAG TPA: transglycosylase, partial [Hyphomonadaceae bacterium]|nr:transglycosylase [Hyphomonadaceae bacterium]